MENTGEPRTLRAFISRLDRLLSARAMHEAATLNGYETTLAAVRSARTVLGIAKSRKHYERKSGRRTTPSPVADFTPPSDQAILEHLILKNLCCKLMRTWSLACSKAG